MIILGPITRGTNICTLILAAWKDEEGGGMEELLQINNKPDVCLIICWSLCQSQSARYGILLDLKNPPTPTFDILLSTVKQILPKQLASVHISHTLDDDGIQRLPRCARRS